MKSWVAAAMAFLAGVGSAKAAPLAAPNQTAENAYLAKAAAAPGAVVLPGIVYQVMKSGPVAGPHPNRADSITVRYVGRFTDGTVFNASPDDGKSPTTFELNKLIPGWVAALRLMRPGDQWRLIIPAYLAYGSFGKTPYIPPDATLVFEVELISVTSAPPSAPAPNKSGSRR